MSNFPQEAFDRLCPEDLDPFYHAGEEEEEEEEEESEEETLPDPDELASLLRNEDILFLAEKERDYDDDLFTYIK